MKQSKIKGNQLKKLGLKDPKLISMVLEIFRKAMKHASDKQRLNKLQAVLEDAEAYRNDAIFGAFVAAISDVPQKEKTTSLHDNKPFRIYGDEEISEPAKHQMYSAMKLPITVDGAIMPDAHYGYGLPIGGVLATNNAVIPYGVGVDIGCRMCLSIFREGPEMIETRRDELKSVLFSNTKFGLKERFARPNEAPVLDSPLFGEIKMLKRLQAKAFEQLGSSGGGNHFVEFGEVEIPTVSTELGVKAGKYFALLSHSGSRGLGANIALHYTKLAKKQSRLPKGIQHLSWLDLDSEEGMEYWLAMNLAGEYASACHHDIHKRICKVLKLQATVVVENHHNFAWKEQLADGTEVIVHRKGATPAGKDVLGVIPGSMTKKGYIVKGLGNPESIYSASHGAGRQMSRREAKQSITRNAMNKELKLHGVELIGGGLDESPMAYKDIDTVMSHQQDLVEVLGSFTPKIVRMANE